MIEFIQDYTTKALPPESFKNGDQVERSKESELYFVRLGVAGFVHEGKLVDQDFRPIAARTAIVEVVGQDHRFVSGGRGGELLGVDAPQRATAGPGNRAMFASTAVSTGPSTVQIEQMRSDLAASMQQLDEHREMTTGQIADLTNELTAAQGAREAALADLAAAQADHATIATDRDAARVEATTSAARVVELEAALAAANAAAAAATSAPKTK